MVDVLVLFEVMGLNFGLCFSSYEIGGIGR